MYESAEFSGLPSGEKNPRMASVVNKPATIGFIDVIAPVATADSSCDL